MHLLRGFLLTLIGYVLLSSLLISPALAASGSTLLLTPSATSFGAGDTISLQVQLNEPTSLVSAVSVAIHYSTGLIYNSTSFTNSVFDSAAAAPAVSNNIVTFARVRTDTGFSGSNGLIATLNFTATTSGQQTFTIDKDSSQVVAYSDSSNILQDVAGTNITVTGSVPLLTQTGINISIITSFAAVLTAGAFFLSRRKVLKKQERRALPTVRCR